jgi:hypothetical protein
LRGAADQEGVADLHQGLEGIAVALLLDPVGKDGVAEVDVVALDRQGSLHLDRFAELGAAGDLEDAVDVDAAAGAVSPTRRGVVLLHSRQGEVAADRHVGASQADLASQDDSSSGTEGATRSGAGIGRQVDGVGGVDGIPTKLRVGSELRGIHDLCEQTATGRGKEAREENRSAPTLHRTTGRLAPIDSGQLRASGELPDHHGTPLGHRPGRSLREP